MPSFPPEYRGITSPTYTQTPDEFFDFMMPFLSESEVKVLLYLMRHTFGYKKEDDRISLDQFSGGIVSKDGRRVDYGTGLKRSAVQKALKALRDAGVVVATPTVKEDGGTGPTSYRLCVGEGWSLRTTGGGPARQGGAHAHTTGDGTAMPAQETISQDIITQQGRAPHPPKARGLRAAGRGPRDYSAGSYGVCSVCLERPCTCPETARQQA